MLLTLHKIKIIFRNTSVYQRNDKKICNICYTFTDLICSHFIVYDRYLLFSFYFPGKCLKYEVYNIFLIYLKSKKIITKNCRYKKCFVKNITR